MMMSNDDNECVAVGGMFDRRNRSTRRNPAPVSLCDVIWVRTQVTAGEHLALCWLLGWHTSGQRDRMRLGQGIAVIIITHGRA